MSATSASEDPYYIESVPMYYDFAHDHDNTIGDRFFDMQGQAFDSSPVAYERVRTPLPEVNGASAMSHETTQPVAEPPRQRRVSKTNMVEQFSKEIQKRRSINTTETVQKGVAAPLRPSGGVPPPPLKNATVATAHPSSVFKKNKSINPTVIGTIGIKTTPISQRVANSPMRLRPKRNSSLDKERSKEKVAAKTKEEEGHGSKQTASSESIFKPRCLTDKKATAAAGVARPPPLQRRSISSVVAGGASDAVAPIAPAPKAVDYSKINPGHNKQAPPKSIFSSQNKSTAKKPASSGTTFAMRLRSSAKEKVEKEEDGAGSKAFDDKADTASNKSEEGKARRFSHYMAPTIASRRRSNMGVAVKVAK